MKDDRTIARVTTKKIREAKGQQQKISMVTCYDAAFARIVDLSAIDIILVGDSVGNVVLGFDQTISVTLEHMIHHTAAVTRVTRRALVCADMPFMTYYNSDLAIKNAARLIQEGGAQCVKLEGGSEIIDQVKALVKVGIPVIGHLGLTPQKIHAISGYCVQATQEEEQKKLFSDALNLVEAGVFAIVLEMIPRQLAYRITSQLPVPTIGIGAGIHCDGQVLVLHDLLGFNKQFKPRFLKKYFDMEEVVVGVLNQFDQEVKTLKFPQLEHSYED